MRIGNQTAFSAADWRDPFRFARAHGFGAFEWFADRHGPQGWDFASCDSGCRRALRSLGASSSMVFSVHAPAQCNPRTLVGQEELGASLEFACDVDARLVVLHLPAGEHEQAWAEALKEPLRSANRAGLQLAFENTVLTAPRDCNRVFGDLRQRYGPDAPVGLCLDVGHANLCEATHNDYVRFVDALDQALPIVHVHLHENWGETDQHLVLFTGPLARDDSGLRALLGRLKGRGYRGVFILEQWPEPPELLVTARERLARLLEAMGDVVD
jgi:sugar phosphate isomerase/epimerase